ncbi:MAG: hypothetical protein IJR90_03110 [Clostridia bacterium]|nr:hypothetical protein [Clostridia bacterium]
MRTETGRNIERYKRSLPKIKERIIAAGLMLLIAMALVVGSTFAWITLSSAPEVSNIATTVAANGSLEIALEDGDDTTYPTSGRGDSYAAQGKSIVTANVTWGNIVNLSDESYGLQNIQLRPARLNTANLSNNPLWGAVYGADGRVTTLNTDYAFSVFDSTEQKFLVSSQKGVRAISSYTMIVTDGQQAEAQAGINRMKQPVLTAINNVNAKYAGSVMTEENIEGLRGLLNAYISGALTDYIKEMSDDTYNGTAAAETDITAYLGQIYSLYNEFYQAMELQKEAFVALANFQRYIASIQDGGEPYSELDWATIAASPAAYDAASAAEGSAVRLTGLSAFVTDLAGASADLASLRTYYENSQSGSHYTYSAISPIVNRLANPNGVTINGKSIGNIGVSEIASLLNSPNLVLSQGYLKDFEQIALQNVSRMNVSMSFNIDQSMIETIPHGDDPNATDVTKGLYNTALALINQGGITATLNTNAKGVGYTEKDMATASNQSLTLAGGTPGAEDTYGLAVDLWLRTNTTGSYLILQGGPDAEVTDVRVQGADGDGNTVDLYTATISQDGNDIPNVDVYTKDNKWYYNKTDTEVTVSGAPTAKMQKLTTVTGYKGVNRVWNESEKPLLTEDSVTQGNGSCFVFYADTPEDHARFLRVLKAMNVVFVDGEGELLATAVMDTVNSYADSGKVTVPLVIKDPTMVLKTEESVDQETGETVTTSYYEEMRDNEGNVVYGIMPLQKNVSTALTAILFLNGDDLGNEDVLSASSIQGQLNLQFGTTPAVTAADNSILENATRSVSASISGTTEFEFDGEPKNVTVNVNVEGENPAKISAAFQRVINNSQGKRMETVNFTAPASEDGSWTGSFSFTAPGVYVLREVTADGVSYTLPSPLTVTISGFAVSSVTWSEPNNVANIYSTDSTYSEYLSISFGSSSYDPRTVRLVFMNENSGSSVSTAMVKDGDLWKGTAVFGTSGTYTLSYAEVDGEYYDLGNFKKTLSLSLGLSARVSTTSPTREYFDANQTYAKNMSVQIVDNGGQAMEGLTAVQLVYSRGGSTSDTVTAQLTWNNSTKRYEGELPIVNTGTYSFLRVTVGGSSITGVNGEPPVFYLRESNPVSYDTNSASTYGAGTVQYAPVSLDAFIGPIRIANSQTAYISAVVHNSVTGQDYPITQATGRTTPGTMYYDANAWYINLPTYRDAKGADSQDGVWSVKSITLWDVVDGNGNVRSADNKLTWTDGEDGVDFSALSTTVSSTISVVMEPGTTAIGDGSTPFMTNHPFSTLGAYVTVKDNTGYVIPAERISSVDLHLNYVDNKNPAYGYTVTGNTCQPVVRFNRLENGQWLVTDDVYLQYVGEYTVTDLTVTMADGNTVTTAPGNGGVPAVYTVTSAAASSDNVTLVVTQSQTVYGKSGDTVNGLFLQSYAPAVSVKPTVTYKDAQNRTQLARFADFNGIDGATVTLRYKPEQGKQAPNGGYTWTGTSAYETVEYTMTAAGGGSYAIDGSDAKPLLAGEYEIASLGVTVGGTTSTLTGGDIYAASAATVVTSLDDLGAPQVISVWSKSPTVTMSNAVSTLGTTYHPFETNRNAGTANNTASAYSLHLADNEISADGYEATLRFVTQKTSGSSWRAAPPRIEMALSDIPTSSFTSATVIVPPYDATFTFTPSKTSGAYDYIGNVNGASSGTGDALIINMVGDQTISNIAVTDPNGVVYTVQLSHNLVIHENPEPNATLNNVTVTIEDGDNGEHVSLTVIETRQDGAVMPAQNLAASAESFTVQEGSTLEITANVTDEGYESAKWLLKSSSLHSGTDEITYKPRYESYTEGSNIISVIKQNITITKKCDVKGAKTVRVDFCSGASANYYKSGTMTVSAVKVDSNGTVILKNGVPDVDEIFTYTFSMSGTSTTGTYTFIDDDGEETEGSGIVKSSTLDSAGKLTRNLTENTILQYTFTDVEAKSSNWFKLGFYLNKNTGAANSSLTTSLGLFSNTGTKPASGKKFEGTYTYYVRIAGCSGEYGWSIVPMGNGTHNSTITMASESYSSPSTVQ